MGEIAKIYFLEAQVDFRSGHGDYRGHLLPSSGGVLRPHLERLEWEVQSVFMFWYFLVFLSPHSNVSLSTPTSICLGFVSPSLSPLPTSLGYLSLDIFSGHIIQPPDLCRRITIEGPIQTVPTDIVSSLQEICLEK